MLHALDFAGAAASAGLVYKTLDCVDGKLNAKTKGELNRWLTNHSSMPPTSVFAGLIDLVFGSRVLSARFFFRSCLAGLIALTTVLIVYLRLNDQNPEGVDQVAPIFALNAIASVIPTYLSMIVSRSVVRAMVSKTDRRRIAALVFFDFGLKVALATATIFLASIIVHAQDSSVWTEAWHAMSSFFQCGWGSLPFFTHEGNQSLTAYGLLFYPVFFTSIWIWIFLGSGVLARALGKIDLVCRFFAAKLDFESRPLGSAGLILASLSWVVILGASPFL